MNFLEIVQRILTMLPSAIQQIITALSKLFDSLGQDKAQAVTQEADELAHMVESNPKVALDWFVAMYPDIPSLLKAWPKLPCLMYVANSTQKDQRINMHVALTAAQLAANEIKFERS